MAGSKLLQSFWDLSSLEEEHQLMAAEKLIGELNVSKESGSFEQELTYCTTRLISGLASNRKGARQGYFIALCEVLTLYSQFISTESVLKLICEKLECVGNVKASEERGSFIGQLFAFLALIQSKRDFKPMEIKTLVQKLMNLYLKKVPLRELTVRILLELLCQLKEESEGVHILVLPYLELECGWNKCTPDSLLLLITLEKYFGDEVWYTDFITAHWSGCGHILSKENFDRMATVLLTSSQSHPRVHSVWPHLFNHFKGTAEWAIFWSVIIESSLLKSTRERKFLVYQLIEKYVMPSMGVADIGVVMTPMLFRQLHTNTRAIQHSLYEASLHLLNEIVKCSLDMQELCVAVWLQLIKSGSLFPDYISQFQSKLTCEGVVKYVEHIIKETLPVYNSSQTLLDHITILLKHLPSHCKQSDWLIQLAEHLILKTHFNSSSANPVCDDNEEGVVLADKEKLFQLKTIQLITELIKISKQSTSVEVPQTLWSVSMVTHIQELLNSENIKLKLEMNSEEKEMWLESIYLLNNLNEKPTEYSAVFLQLISLSLLEMLWDRETGLNTTKELILCYGQMIDSTTKKTPAKKRRKSLAPSQGPEWIEMLVDIILSLLSRQQQMWPLVIEKCFPFVIPHLTVNAFQLIVKALEPQDVEDLMMTEDERKGQEDDEIGKTKGKKNKSKKTKKEDEEKEEEEEEESEKEEKESGEEDEDEDEEDKRMQFFDPSAEFLADVRNALGDVAAVDSDQESIMSIDDEQMEVLDEALSAIFRKRQEKTEQKKQKKVNEVTMMQFKMRLLHLTELFVKYNYSNPLMLYLIKPLYLLSVSYHNHKTLSPLSNRATPILERLCKTKKYSKEGVDTAPLHSFLEHLLTTELYKANKNTSLSIVSCIMFLIKVIKGVSPPPLTVPSPMATRSTRKRKRAEVELSSIELLIISVTKWSQKALDHMISSKNSSVPNKYFEVLCQAHPEIGINLLPTLVSALGRPGNHFRLMLGYSLVVTILQRCKEQFSPPSEDIVQSILSLSNLCTTALLTPPTTTTTNKKGKGSNGGVINLRPILECIECIVNLYKSIDMLSQLDIDGFKTALSVESILTSRKTEHLSRNILKLLNSFTEENM